jgi:serine/threonine-protein phosphatase 2A activator
VWGLDEYQFFPFIFGASQLQGHPRLRPTSITSDDTLEAYANDYMYMDAVRFVRSVKKGPLHETSPMLYDISGVATWKKVRPLFCLEAESCFALHLTLTKIGHVRWMSCQTALQCWLPMRCAHVQVNQGLFKMYQVELLSKLPIMQHTLWGSLLPFPGSEHSP